MQSEETEGANSELFKENVETLCIKIHIKSDSAI